MSSFIDNMMVRVKNHEESRKQKNLKISEFCNDTMFKVKIQTPVLFLSLKKRTQNIKLKIIFHFQ